MKQPWEMTKDEWWAEFQKTQINFSGCGGGGVDLNIKKGIALHERREFLKMNLPDTWEDDFQIPARHYQVVKHAVSLGLPVPSHVLAEYPQIPA